MYLSYSGFLTYDTCGLSYWHKYVNHTKIDTVDNRLGSVFGTSLGKLVERFYRDKMWRLPQPQSALEGLAEETVEEVLLQEVTARKPGATPGVLLWKGMPGANPKAYANKVELIADVRDHVGRIFKIIRHDRLLGPQADVEFKLDSDIEGHRIAGRSDLILRRTKPNNDLVLLDGKGSAWREQYSDTRQLLWYAYLYHEKFGAYPDKLGFIYWRFDPPDSIDWIESDPDEIVKLKESIFLAIRSIEAGEKLVAEFPDQVEKAFPPKPSKNACQYCPFRTEAQCHMGTEAYKKLTARKKFKPKDPESV